MFAAIRMKKAPTDVWLICIRNMSLFGKYLFFSFFKNFLFSHLNSQPFLFSPTDKRPDSFYLHPIPNIQSTASIWYARRPVGIHTIEKFLKSMTAKVGETGKYTPHSLRATTATQLFEKGIDEQLIQETTGHSSSAVRLYKHTSSSMKEAVSKILQPSCKPHPPSWLLPVISKQDSEDEFKPPPRKKSLATSTITKNPDDIFS